jgi:hypothetical protein
VGTGSVGERVQRLAELWRAVLSTAQHPMGCNCAGHALAAALNAVDLEHDILHYLRDRYADEGLTGLVSLLDRRRAQHDAGSVLAFRSWLLQLPDHDLDGEALDRLLTDLLGTLSSFESNRRRTPTQ